jgi:hypothetical protein
MNYLYHLSHIIYFFPVVLSLASNIVVPIPQLLMSMTFGLFFEICDLIANAPDVISNIPLLNIMDSIRLMIRAAIIYYMSVIWNVYTVETDFLIYYYTPIFGTLFLDTFEESSDRFNLAKNKNYYMTCIFMRLTKIFIHFYMMVMVDNLYISFYLCMSGITYCLKILTLLMEFYQK